MKYRPLPFSYTLVVLRADPFILPAAVWALFVLMAWMLRDRMSTGIIAAYLGFTLPLLSGILGAYAVLEDRSLELLLASPRPAGWTIAERLGVILVFQAVLAVAFQLAAAVLGMDMSYLGGPLERQLAWFVPTLALTALGVSASFWFADCIGGALMVGAIWIVQLLLRGWFIRDALWRCFLLFAGVMAPGYPFLAVNRIMLLIISAGLLVLAAGLFGKQERYL